MAKALSMGMSAEQFEKKFGIEKPFYEARTEKALGEAAYYKSAGTLLKERNKMRQKFVLEAEKSIPEIRKIDLELLKEGISEGKRNELKARKKKLIDDYVNDRMDIVGGNISNLPNIAESAFTSKTGVPIMLPKPGQTGTE